MKGQFDWLIKEFDKIIQKGAKKFGGQMQYEELMFALEKLRFDIMISLAERYEEDEEMINQKKILRLIGKPENSRYIG